MPPQNIPLWDIDYFKLFMFEAQKAQEEALTFPLSLKEFNIEGVTQDPQPGTCTWVWIFWKNHQGEKCHLLLIRQGSFNSSRSELQEEKLLLTKYKQSVLCPQAEKGVISLGEQPPSQTDESKVCCLVTGTDIAHEVM